LDDIHAGVLAEAVPAARKALAQGVRPLMMEMEEWNRADDVFPIELADMMDASEPLHGGNPSFRAAINPGPLRIQAERELRVKLLHLHSGMLAAGDNRARLGELLVRALPSFTAYLRTALRLSGNPVPGSSGEVITQGCSLVGADPTAFLAVLSARSAGGKLGLSLQDPVTDQFNTAAERLAAFTDAFGEMMQ
jgi:hypothetical protein